MINERNEVLFDIWKFLFVRIYRICSFFSLFCDNYAWFIRVQANATAKVGCFKPVFHYRRNHLYEAAIVLITWHAK